MRKNPYHYFFSFFGLRENPFAVSPDPGYLFMTPQIQKVWDALAYGIQSREGIILLTGQAGTGKTTLIYRLLDWLRERRMPAAFIFNSHLEPRHLFDFMLADFGVPPDPLWNGNPLLGISQWLLERSREGRIPVLIIDEAQGLPLHVLEEIRLLLNFETPHEKLLQIVLAGQPELAEKLKLPEMRHLTQRIALRCKTEALTVKEAHDYIQARLDIAGASGKAIFSPDAMNAVHAFSRGIPRVMNLICEHSLINAYAANLHVVPARLVIEIAREFQFDPESHAPSFVGGFTATSARLYEPLVFPEPSTAPVPAAIASAPSPTETAVMFASSATTGPVATPKLREQPAMSDPDRANPVDTLREPGPVPLLLGRSNLGVGSSNAPAKSGEANVSANRQSIGKILPTLLPIVIFPNIPRGLTKNARDLREELYRAWVRLAVHRWSRAISNAVCYLQLWWWQEAAPALRRITASWLDWLRQPLPRQFSSSVHSPNHPRSNPRTTLAQSLNVTRSRKSSRPKFQPVALPSHQLSANSPVSRWLRQPFRS